MGNGEGSAPYAAQDAAEFSEAMRRLKERSGLTYRQLEEKAAGQGEPLPRSTLANALTGRSLPRPELLAAFVRACGEGDRAADWARARNLLADRSRTGTPPSPVAPSPPPPPSPKPGLRTAWRAARRTPALLALTALLTAAALTIATVWTPASSDRAPGTAAPPLPTGPVLLHPLSAPDLCLTDGHVPDGRYDSLVAVQRPCDEVAPQRTRLIPAGGGLYRIEWFRPDQGKGCLAARYEGPAAGLLEPQNDCGGATRLHAEHAPTHGSTAYAFRAEATHRCLTINAPATPKSRESGKSAEAVAGTEAVLTPCATRPNQLFRITKTPLPSQ
ncbi:helix-turn-helix domain-containing protein [Streptomyces ochraceiscleroticus]|uniref:Helix-turn-helix domain-containing protein n=1 Tax=Streptomyces ochraceiscleroticus TaxID=47761 RepID=A0ABW1MLL0_9ACTN|nr:helix-turn-helix transcriptional regulator [Streptomyces ochraceiscleroticus]